MLISLSTKCKADVQMYNGVRDFWGQYTNLTGRSNAFHSRPIHRDPTNTLLRCQASRLGSGRKPWVLGK